MDLMIGIMLILFMFLLPFVALLYILGSITVYLPTKIKESKFMRGVLFILLVVCFITSIILSVSTIKNYVFGVD